MVGEVVGVGLGGASDEVAVDVGDLEAVVVQKGLDLLREELAVSE